MTPEDIKGIVLRHRFLVEKVGLRPDAVDDFLDLPEGTTEAILKAEQDDTEERELA